MSQTTNTLGVNVAMSELIRAECERDAVQAELERLRGELTGLTERVFDLAFREGAESMRHAAMEACRPMLRDMVSRSSIAQEILNLPLPRSDR